MASTIFNRLSGTAQAATVPNPTEATTANSMVNQILQSANPQQMFSQMLASNPNAKNAMDLINQYGNGDPKAAFMNYMSAQGKQAVGQAIMQRFGLG